jgi:hypothetical protein
MTDPGTTDTTVDSAAGSMGGAQLAGSSSPSQREAQEPALESRTMAATTDVTADAPNDVARAGTADWESGQFVFPGFSPSDHSADDSAATTELGTAVRAMHGRAVMIDLVMIISARVASRCEDSLCMYCN